MWAALLELSASDDSNWDIQVAPPCVWFCGICGLFFFLTVCHESLWVTVRYCLMKATIQRKNKDRRERDTDTFRFKVVKCREMIWEAHAVCCSFHSHFPHELCSTCMYVARERENVSCRYLSQTHQRKLTALEEDDGDADDDQEEEGAGEWLRSWCDFMHDVLHDYSAAQSLRCIPSVQKSLLGPAILHQPPASGDKAALMLKLKPQSLWLIQL